jgi:hypothetical protein
VAVHRLRSQEAQHDSGAILRSHGRDAMQFELGGRTMTIGVDRGAGAVLFRLSAAPRWDDGTPVETDVLGTLRPIITEIARFWGSTAEFRTLAG